MLSMAYQNPTGVDVDLHNLVISFRLRRIGWQSLAVDIHVIMFHLGLQWLLRRKYSVILWEGMLGIRLVVMAGCLDRLGLFRGRGYGEGLVGVSASGWVVLGGSSSRLPGVSVGSGSQGRNR